MPSATIPNTVQCDVVFLLFNQRVENVVHIECPDGVDAPTIQDCANLVGNWVEDHYLPNLSADVTFLSVEAKNLSIDNGGVAIYNAAPGVTGGVTSASNPGNVSYTISLLTAASGRSFRGRKYVIGVPQFVVTGNQVSATWSAALVDAFNELRDILVAADKLLVVVSRVADGLERLVGVTTAVTSAGVSDLNTDSQRRRLNGRGS